MKKEYSFTSKTIIIAGVIALALLIAIGGICFSVGHDNGYIEGSDIGYAEGHESGYDEGYDVGYDTGFSAAEDSMAMYPIGDYYVNTDSDPLTIRDEAAQNSTKVGTIPRGEDVTVTKVSSHWGYVTFEGISGWINLDYCAEGKNPNPPAEYSSETVYVTNTGSKYHRDGCQYLHSSKIPISLEEAEKYYSPCSKCF